MLRAAWLLALPFVLALAAAGCGPRGGDPCQSDFSCGTNNTCDLTQADGYCTRTPCRNRGCDDEDAVCIVFDNGESYCMLGCAGSDDCRDGHACHSGTAAAVSYCYAE